MSLINEMLQDLDSRKRQAEVSDVAPDSAAASPMEQGRSPWMLVAFGLVVVALLGYVAVQPAATNFWSPQQDVEMPVVAPVISAVVNESTDTDKPVEIVEPLEVESVETKSAIEEYSDGNKSVQMAEQPQPEPATSDSVVEQNQTTISQLLTAAEQALQNNLLSVPKGRSAYDLYRKVLALHPDNPQAMTGLEKIKTRYIGLIEDALAKNKFRRAQNLVNRVEGLSLPFVPAELLAYRNRIGEQQLAAAGKAAPTEANTNVDTAQAESDNTYLAINKTLFSREAAVAREAQQMLALGRGREAESLLENFIAGSETANLSRLLLFDYYLGQTRLAQAKALMEPVRSMDVSTLAYMNARLALMSSDTATAIAMLEKQQPGDGIRETYNALLAGLYQKEKMHGKAAKLYAGLIEINPTNVTYWLGVGVSRDALGQYQPALNAYNMVIAHKGLDEKVRHFVRARIEALSSRKSPQELAEAGAAW